VLKEFTATVATELAATDPALTVTVTQAEPKVYDLILATLKNVN